MGELPRPGDPSMPGPVLRADLRQRLAARGFKDRQLETAARVGSHLFGAQAPADLVRSFRAAAHHLETQRRAARAVGAEQTPAFAARSAQAGFTDLRAVARDLGFSDVRAAQVLAAYNGKATFLVDPWEVVRIPSREALTRMLASTLPAPASLDTTLPIRVQTEPVSADEVRRIAELLEPSANFEADAEAAAAPMSDESLIAWVKATRPWSGQAELAYAEKNPALYAARQLGLTDGLGAATVPEAELTELEAEVAGLPESPASRLADPSLRGAERARVRLLVKLWSLAHFAGGMSLREVVAMERQANAFGVALHQIEAETQGGSEATAAQSATVDLAGAQVPASTLAAAEFVWADPDDARDAAKLASMRAGWEAMLEDARADTEDRRAWLRAWRQRRQARGLTT
jgi:hypothetical protein